MIQAEFSLIALRLMSVLSLPEDKFLKRTPTSTNDMVVELKKIQAYVVLGKQFALHLLKKVVPKTRSGANLFLKNYQKDNIFVIPPQIRSQMPEYSRCYSCRLCDIVCPEIMMQPTKMAPSAIVMGISRSLTDYVYFNSSAPDCGTCSKCESACPESVPIRALIDFMEKQGRLLKSAAS